MTPDDFLMESAKDCLGRQDATIACGLLFTCSLTGECVMDERERKLATWAYTKWKKHRFTSLRVSEFLSKKKITGPTHE